MDQTARDGDAALVARSAGGDRGAFGELLRRHDARMRAVAYKILAGDRVAMDDVLQEAYLKAYRAVPSFRGDAAFGTWLCRIVYNECVDEIRRSRGRPEPVDAGRAARAEASARPGPERVVTATDTVVRALAGLPPDQRATVLLVDGEGFDNLEAAAVLGVAPGTVASRLSRARAAIRSALGEEAR